MKRRIRTLARKGWGLVQVDPLTADQAAKYSLPVDPNFGPIPINLDHRHYRDLCDWCNSNVPDSEWASSFTQGRKRFAFKDHKFATWFKLMTLPDPTKSCE